ncbi:hypothetical protein BBOV_III009330 [Babesia bovis T2Bo]|uniref:hypothetical protein n=1 Tax=Babesia bovis T2Bo TaxID=484906 RepID=UPI001C357442|nr:hypothetical protein BBOV_III009330 [Babesia bovis T2Bo]EDO08489.2 hypothetical protein BBOV_III009330 [Babesia bovis T2Bo]
MWLYNLFFSFLGIFNIICAWAHIDENNINGSPVEKSSPIAPNGAPLEIAKDTNEIDNKAKPVLDPEGSFKETLKANVAKPTPVERLDALSKDIEKEISSNPYFKIPKYDRKLRELAILHPTVMESLGVYVIPIKKPTREPETTKHDDDIPSADAIKKEEDDKSDKDKSATAIRSNLSYIIKQSEMIKAMTPEEKLQFIPRLKDTIVYEIMKNVRTIEELSAQIASNLGNESTRKH